MELPRQFRYYPLIFATQYIFGYKQKFLSELPPSGDGCQWLIGE
jgi:hypothetical protein